MYRRYNTYERIFTISGPDFRGTKFFRRNALSFAQGPLLLALRRNRKFTIAFCLHSMMRSVYKYDILYFITAGGVPRKFALKTIVSKITTRFTMIQNFGNCRRFPRSMVYGNELYLWHYSNPVCYMKFSFHIYILCKEINRKYYTRFDLVSNLSFTVF